MEEIKERLDRIDLIEVSGSTPPEKLLYLRIIQDAVYNYLYGFLGKNGISPDEFYYSWLYLFKIKPNKINTLSTTSNLDSHDKIKYFDKHYEISGLSTYMEVNKFQAALKKQRELILTNNWERVENYINTLYSREVSLIADGQYQPFRLWEAENKRILIEPDFPYQLASLIYLPKKLRKKKVSKAKHKISKYQDLAKQIQSGNSIPLGNNWGPIAEYISKHDETTCNNSNNRFDSNNIGCNPNTSTSYSG